MRGAVGAERAPRLQLPRVALAQRCSPAAGVLSVAAPRCHAAALRRPAARHAASRAQASNGNGSGNGEYSVATETMVLDATASGSPFTKAAAEASPALRGTLGDGCMARWLLELRANGALVRQPVPTTDVGKVCCSEPARVAGRAGLSVPSKSIAAPLLTVFAPRSTFSVKRTGANTATPGAMCATS